MIAYLLIYALLLAAYIGVLFYLAPKAVSGDFPRPRTTPLGDMAADHVSAE